MHRFLAAFPIAGMALIVSTLSHAAERTGPLPTFEQSENPIRVAPPASVGKKQYQLAQSADNSYRVLELENEIRRLNGKVEELTFQLLELQEQIRKMQEDNELRFQELEDQSSNLSDKDETKEVASTEDNRLGKPEPSGGNLPDGKQTTSEQDNPGAGRQLGSSPKILGTLTFDKDGNVVAGGTNNQPTTEIDQTPLPGVFNDGVDGGVEAAQFGPTPFAVLQVGKSALGNKRYKRAESAMRAFLKAWPKDPSTAEARFQLAEAMFWQGGYFKAANIYLDTHNAHPKAKTAPDNLLGLGLSLAGLNQREVACATYAEVLKQYPSAAPRLGKRVAAEQASARC